MESHQARLSLHGFQGQMPFFSCIPLLSSSPALGQLGGNRLWAGVTSTHPSHMERAAVPLALSASIAAGAVDF